MLQPFVTEQRESSKSIGFPSIETGIFKESSLNSPETEVLAENSGRRWIWLTIPRNNPKPTLDPRRIHLNLSSCCQYFLLAISNDASIFYRSTPAW